MKVNWRVYVLKTLSEIWLIFINIQIFFSNQNFKTVFYIFHLYQIITLSKIILYSAGLKGTVCNNLIYIHSFLLCFFLRAMNLLIFLVVNKIFYLLCIYIFLRDKHSQVCYKRISVVIWKKYIWQGEIDCPLHTNVFFFYRYNFKSWYWSLLSNSFFLSMMPLK